MALYLNTVTVGGYLVRDPDGSPTKDGLPRTKFVIALNNPAKKKPEYIKCVAWGERAATIARYASRGQEIIVSGELETTTWTDRHKMNHTTTEIVVEKFNLGKRPSARPEGAAVRMPAPPISAE
jgi:single-strand DNA-binding protein